MTKDKRAIVVFMLLAVVVAILTVLCITSVSSVDNKFESSQQPIEEKSDNFKIYSSKEDAINALNSLTIAEADDSDYSGNVREEKYGTWKSAKRSNTRAEVLKAQSENVETDYKNKVVSGTWKLPYNGETVSYSTKEEISKNLQIDHVVPVSYAHRHGASSWSEDKRQEFYNDYGVESVWSNGDNSSDDYKNVGNLVVSDSKSNIQKSDSGPSKWLPSNKDYVLEYCEEWVSICSSYGISISKADYDTIKLVFETE